MEIAEIFEMIVTIGVLGGVCFAFLLIFLVYAVVAWKGLDDSG